MKILYTAKATSTGGRDGSSQTDDGKLKVKLDRPAEMGGKADGAGTNPEQLFAVGYSACFLGALHFVAGKEKVQLPADTAITGLVGIGPRDDGSGFSLNVELQISAAGVEKPVLEGLVQKAHIVCPYSEATRGNLDVKLTVL